MKQGLWTESLRPQYPVGFRIQVGLKVFHYSRAVTALQDKRGAGDGSTVLEMIVPAAPGYTGDLTVTLGTGAGSCAAVVAHEYKGGWFCTYGPVYAQTLLRVKDNDAAIVDAATFYLQDPIIRDMPVTETSDLYRNIYNNVNLLSGAVPNRVYMSVVGVPLIPVQAGYYFLGQTWGPCITLAQDVGIGAVALERAVYFAADGTIGTLLDCPGGATQLPQYAGYLLGQTTGVGPAFTPADSIFYMLQLAP